MPNKTRESRRVSRRQFLRGLALAGGSAALMACAPKVVEKTVVVEKPVEKVVKETVIVEGTPQVVEKVVTATPAPVEPVTVTWMNWWGGAREPLMLEVIARFEEENPHIHVENQLQPWDNRAERAATAIASKSPPSLIMIPRLEMQKFAHEGLIVPIDPYIEAEGIDVYEIFYESEINNCRWGEHFYSYPLPTGGGMTAHWLYNKNVFRDAGLDPEKPPKTWQEVEEVIKATTVIEDGVLQKVGLAGVGSFHFPAWLYCNNGKYYSDDSKQLLFNQPEGVETLEWMAHLINDYFGGIETYNAFFEGVDFQNADYPFYTDRLAIQPHNVSAFYHFETFAPEMYADPDQWGVSLVAYNGNNPQAKATGISGFYFAWNQVIPKGLDQKVQDAAYKWLEFFTMRRAGGCWFLFKQHRPSPVKECNENPEYYEGNPHWDATLEGMKIDISVPVTPVQGEIEDLVTEAVEEVWFGLKKPKEALDWAYEKAQPILDKFWSGS